MLFPKQPVYTGASKTDPLALLRKEFHAINWYSPMTPEEFHAILLNKNDTRCTWATAELLLHGSWKLAVTLLGLKGMAERWEDIREQYKRNQFTERLYRDMEYVTEYLQAKDERSTL